MASNAKQVPKDAQVIVSIMRDMGITDYEPKVVNQLLEFTYRYVTCILDDSKIYASHSKKKFIDSEDVRLAVQMQSENSFTNPPPREILLDVAKIKNNVPLPFVKPSYGLRLPPDRYCLNGTNYKLKTPSKKTGRIGNSHASGAMNKGNSPSFSIIKRPTTLSAYSRSQTISVPKPIPKVVTNTATVSTKPVIQQQVQPKMPTAPDPGQVAMPTIKTEPEESLKRKREDDDYDVP